MDNRIAETYFTVVIEFKISGGELLPDCMVSNSHSELFCIEALF